MSRNESRTSVLLGAVAGLLVIGVGAFVVLISASHDQQESAVPAVTEIVIDSAAPAPPPVVVAPAEAPPPVPAGSVVVQGGQCLPSEVRSFGTDVNGQSLVCTSMGAVGGYVWVGHAPNSGEVHNIGEPCDPAVDGVAQDPAGYAIMCGGETWTDGP